LTKQEGITVFRPLGFRRALYTLAVFLSAIASLLGALHAAEPPAVGFEGPVATETGQSEPVDVEQADLDGDGFWDAAVLTSPAGQGYLQFLHGTGRSVLDGTPLPLEKQGESLLVPFAAGFGVGDFNEDGRPDLAVAQRSKAGGLTDGIYCGATPGAMIFLGGSGAFEFSTCLAGLATGHNLTDAVSGDFDGDGHTDVVVAASNVSGLRTYSGNGDGTFDAPVNAASLAVFGPLATSDLDADGDLDVVGRSSLTGGVRMALNDGTGVFTFSPAGIGTPLFSVTSITSFAVGFVDNDAIPDVAGVVRGRLSSAGDPVQDFTFVSLGAFASGTLSYTAAGYQLLGDGTAGTVLIADFDKDLARDIVVAYDGFGVIDDAARVYLGNGDGTFAAAILLGAGQLSEARLAVTGDWNKDHWLDLAVIDRNQGNESRTWIFEQSPGLADAAGPAVAIVAPTSNDTLGGAVTVIVDATDPADVDRVTVFHGTSVIGTARSPGGDGKYRVTWFTTNAPNGAFVLTARAWDMTGSYGTSAAVPVTVNNPDITSPVVSVFADPVHSWTAASPGQVALTATATDINGVTSVEFYYQQSGGALTLIGADSTSPFGLAWNTGEDGNGNSVLDPGEDGNGNGLLDVVLVPAGTYSLIAKAYDAATPPNAGESPAVAVMVDRAPMADAGTDQTLTATSSAGAMLTLHGTGTDPDTDMGDALTFEWFDEFGSPIGPPMPTGSFPIPDPVPPGQYLLVLRVTDSYGVLAEDSVTITVQEQGASLVTVVPTSSQQGQVLAVDLTGQSTHWEQGTTTASIGSGIEVISVTVTSPTSASAEIAVDATAVAGPRDITVTTGIELVTLANAFTVVERVTYPLTIARIGTGTGIVTSAPAGIACGLDCTETLDAGTPITLTALADVNSTFGGWSGGGCTGTGECTLTLGAATTVTATFTKMTFDLTILRAGTGTGTVTSTPAGIACGVDCAETLDAGTLITLSALADVNSTFAGWSGGGCSGISDCTLTLGAAATVTATFTNELLPLLAPGPLTASSQSKTDVYLTWDDNSSDETRFFIERSADNAAWNQIAALPPNTRVYVDNDVTCGKTYFYRVRGYRSEDGRFSPFSNIAPASTSRCDYGRAMRPEILEAELPETIPVNELFHYQFAAKGTPPLTWSLDDAPEGMAIDRTTGLLSWTPTPAQLRRQRFVVRVSNAAGSDRSAHKLSVVDRVNESRRGHPVLVTIRRR
jgi:hypothetical protein